MEMERQFEFVPYNLPLTEKQALHYLKANSNLIIKPADKGGGIGNMDNNKYDAEIMRQLSNKSHFQALPGDRRDSIRNQIQTVTNQARLSDIISKKEYSFLNNICPPTPVIYVLPKIHKSTMEPRVTLLFQGVDLYLHPKVNT